MKIRKAIMFITAAVMIWSGTMTSAMAAGETAAVAGREAAATEDQVVVLYEEGELTSGLTEKKLDEEQTDILDEALDGSYTIEDTLVIEGEADTDSDAVFGVVSSDDYTAEELAEALQESGSVKYAEPNITFRTTSVPDWSDTYLRDSWQVGDRGINADDLGDDFATEKEGDEVVVAVLDTGIDYKHPDLKDRMWTEPDGYPMKNRKKHGVDFITYDNDPMDENGHGTHCAGIIAAAADNGEGVIGVAGKRRDIRLMSVRAFDEEGAGTLSGVVAAYRHLLRARKAGVNIRVANCSFGTEEVSDIFDEVIDLAGREGILTVAAAGNEVANIDKTSSLPAICKSDYAVSVAALDEDGKIASYSNFGKRNVDIAAPGSNILSTVSYYNYSPYLYDNAKLRKTTEVYGEFGGASVTQDAEGIDHVTPAAGTDYNGEEITDLGTFGESRMLSNQVSGSKGKMSLSVVQGEGGFPVGNNSESLRWTISDARKGDEYILYFPYEKQSDAADDTWLNLAVRTYTDRESGISGYLDAGDVIVDKVDDHGKVAWSDYYYETEDAFTMGVSSDANSVWNASGTTGTILPYSKIRGIRNDAADGSGYGLGLVYEARADGTVHMDISSMAISRSGADVTEFGKYDVYSGTSMATPVVSGAAALIAAMNPGMTADDVKATLFASTRESLDAGYWSTNGSLDFSAYKATEDDMKPAVKSAAADFAAGRVTLNGKGFGTSLKVEIHNNTSDDENVWTIVPARASNNSIIIDNAGSGGSGLIGSEISFRITNTASGKTGYFTDYIVKGLKRYKDGFSMPLQDDLMLYDWSYSDRVDIAEEDDEEDEEELTADPSMPAGLNYIPGANELLKYNTEGTIYSVSCSKETKKWEVEQRGGDVLSAILEYAEAEAENNEYWAFDIPDEIGLKYKLIAEPAYLGETVFELVHVDIEADREAVLLLGNSLCDGEYNWDVYYDSLSESGGAAVGRKLCRYDKTVLAAYRGRLYIIGGGTVNADEEIDWMEILYFGGELGDQLTAGTYKEVYSCVPFKGGSSWKSEAALPGARMLGTAIAQNGSLYYMLSNTDIDTIDYNVYKFDGSRWTTAGRLNEAIFTGYSEDLAEIPTSLFLIGISGVGIPCSVGIDNMGILFGGMSFDKSGDSFRFNTSSGKVEPLDYTLWGAAADRDVNGGTAGGRFYAEYISGTDSEICAKYFPINTGYVKIAKEVTGEGSGTVTGGGSYTKGENALVAIKADKGSYIYEIHSKGLSPDLNRKYGKATKESLGTLTTTFKASADANLEVYFGKISTKVLIPSSLTRAVGKRTIDAETDGTINGVKLTSSNRKYARVNKDGTVTFKKAGIGKTVIITATSVENAAIKGTCTVTIRSRESKKFKWGGKKFTTKKKVCIDQPLAKSSTPKKFRAKAKKGKVKLSWKEVKGVNGYLVLKKSGSGRFKQIAKLDADDNSYADSNVSKGKKYRYIVVAYSKVSNRKSFRISPSSATRKVKVK